MFDIKNCDIFIQLFTCGINSWKWTVCLTDVWIIFLIYNIHLYCHFLDIHILFYHFLGNKFMQVFDCFVYRVQLIRNVSFYQFFIFQNWIDFNYFFIFHNFKCRCHIMQQIGHLLLRERRSFDAFSASFFSRLTISPFVVNVHGLYLYHTSL